MERLYSSGLNLRKWAWIETLFAATVIPTNVLCTITGSWLLPNVPPICLNSLGSCWPRKPLDQKTGDRFIEWEVESQDEQCNLNNPSNWILRPPLSKPAIFLTFTFCFYPMLLFFLPTWCVPGSMLQNPAIGSHLLIPDLLSWRTDWSHSLLKEEARLLHIFGFLLSPVPISQRQRASLIDKMYCLEALSKT